MEQRLRNSTCKQFVLRLSDDDRLSLEAYASKRGVKLVQAVRLLIREQG